MTPCFADIYFPAYGEGASHFMGYQMKTFCTYDTYRSNKDRVGFAKGRYTKQIK